MTQNNTILRIVIHRKYTVKKPCSHLCNRGKEQGSFHYRMKNVMQATRMALAIPHRALVSADMDLVRWVTSDSVLVILCPYSSCFLSASLFHSSKASSRWVLLRARASISFSFSRAQIEGDHCIDPNAKSNSGSMDKILNRVNQR